MAARHVPRFQRRDLVELIEYARVTLERSEVFRGRGTGRDGVALVSVKMSPVQCLRR